MNLLRPLYTTVALTLSVLVWSVSFAQSVQQPQSLPERIIQIEDERWTYLLDLYTNIHSRVVLEVLSRECSEESIVTAQNFIDQADVIISRDYMKWSESRMLAKSLSLYQTLVRLSKERVDKNYSWSKYCTLKYAMTWLMKVVRDKHIQMLRDTWLYNDFENVQEEWVSGQIYGVDVKIDTLNTMQWTLQRKALQLPVWLQVVEINPEFFTALDDDERRLMNAISRLVKSSTGATLYGLYSDWILSYEDLEALADVIQFKYTDQCWRLHGEYSVQLVTDRNRNPRNSAWNFIEATPQSLMLTINLCESYFVLKDIADKFERMIVHEIAHHLYYTRDQAIITFENICWLDEWTRSPVCWDDEFISAYAQTNAAEDYAEHFVARREWVDSNNTIIQQKIQHFTSQYWNR